MELATLFAQSGQTVVPRLQQRAIWQLDVENQCSGKRRKSVSVNADGIISRHKYTSRVVHLEQPAVPATVATN